MTTIAVTGAAGRLGGSVVRLLAPHTGNTVVALTRRGIPVPAGVENRIADYDDPPALRRGLAGVDTLVLVSSDGDGTRVLAHHLNVIAAARRCGVVHIVALSGVDADPDSPFCYAITNGVTEWAIRDSGCGFSILRASIFTGFFAHFLRTAYATGDLRVPMGEGRVGLVSRVDVGRALAAQARRAAMGRTDDLTGPEALDGAGLADAAARVWGRPVAYRSIDPADFTAETARTEGPGGPTPTRACSRRSARTAGTGSRQTWVSSPAVNPAPSPMSSASSLRILTPGSHTAS